MIEGVFNTREIYNSYIERKGVIIMIILYCTSLLVVCFGAIALAHNVMIDSEILEYEIED